MSGRSIQSFDEGFHSGVAAARAERQGFHEKLVEVAMAAKRCIEWTKENDPKCCSHRVPRDECRACWNEPEPFPVGIDEWLALKSALIDAGLIPPLNLAKPAADGSSAAGNEQKGKAE